MPKKNNSDLRKSLSLIYLAGYPDKLKNDHDTNFTLDAICRGVMRNPNGYAENTVNEIMRSIHTFIEDKSDNQLEWILSNATESRGYFANIQALRKFFGEDFNSNLDNIPSRKIAVLDGLLSAMNYSCFSSCFNEQELKEKEEKYFDPKSTKKEKEEILKSLTKQQIEKLTIKEELLKIYSLGGNPKYIGASFTQRGPTLSPGRDVRTSKDTSKLTVQEMKDEESGELFYKAPDRPISVASGFLPYKGLIDRAKTQPKLQKFKNPDKGEDSYVKLSVEHKIPLVGHVSGTTVGNLTIADGLLYNRTQKHHLTEEQIRHISGLIAASFHRSRFHSIPEVMIGMEHYLRQIKMKDDSKEIESREDILKLFEDSIILLAESSKQQLHDAIMHVREEITKNAEHVFDFDELKSAKSFNELEIDSTEEGLTVDDIESATPSTEGNLTEENLRDLETASTTSSVNEWLSSMDELDQKDNPDQKSDSRKRKY